MYVKQLVSNAENNIRALESGGYHKEFLSRRARTIISMLALNPQTGKSSGASLGVPSEALLHQHNAYRPALRHGRVRETAQEKRH